MERLLVLWLPSLASEGADGANARQYLTLFQELRALCPFVEPIRFGVFALPVRGPSRFFGGEEAVLNIVRETVVRIIDIAPYLGIADGLFAGEAAARAHLVVPVGHTMNFVRSLPLSALGRDDLATVGRRLGIHTVGEFGDLPVARVGERFNRHALHVHRVARGEESELLGQRDARMEQRLRTLCGDDDVRAAQSGFFGERRGHDLRATTAAHRVRERLGPDGVLRAHVRGGRAPQDRVVLLPWDAPTPTTTNEAEPWPGQLPAPTPATAFRHPVTVGLLDASSRAVCVDARGLLSDTPTQLVFRAGASQAITWFAGPWPQIERWWSARRRRAHVQVVLATNQAFLLYAEGGSWWLAGIYD